MIEAAQIRAARALLNINQADLARRACVHVATIRRLEAAPQIRGAAETLWRIQTALEAAGVEFIPADEAKGPGVRLKDSGAKDLKRHARKGKGSRKAKN